MKKEFKSSSKRVLDLMINSIYTNKDIFLRELISNASDACDKLAFLSLTDKTLKNDDPLEINIETDKENKTITIIDNGIGMNDKELENNLGTIAESGSLKFKEEYEKNNDIIGQFGVGFYSAFMVADKVEVRSLKANETQGYMWSSDGKDGYEITKCDKQTHGTEIKLYLKEDVEEFTYSKYLEDYTIREMVKKYSDYIKYPIKMEVEKSVLKENSENEYETKKEVETLNSMVPIWKKNKKDITEEEYNEFYKTKFMDYQNPLKVIHNNVEGLVSYKSLLFIPSNVPFDYYYKEFKKGLELYTNGVLIMEKCETLLPDYYSFIKGIVDTDDLSLNISRETLQNDKKVVNIAKSLETKIHNELKDMLENDFENYKKFFECFGQQIKYGVYSDYGLNKDKLKDLLVFYSQNKKDLITLDEYVKNMKEDQKEIYYASGETIEKIETLPQIEQVKNKGYDILYLTNFVDEFAIQSLMNYNDKPFKNVKDNSLDLEDEKEKEAISKVNDENKEMLEFMKKELNIDDIKFSNNLTSHPVCLSTNGDLSTEMEKVLKAMPNTEDVKANLVLLINNNHKVKDKLIDLYKNNKDELKNYAQILYAQARLIEGLEVENPTLISNLICDLISK